MQTFPIPWSSAPTGAGAFLWHAAGISLATRSLRRPNLTPLGEAVVAVDASVLIDLYRFRPQTSRDLIETLRSLGDPSFDVSCTNRLLGLQVSGPPMPGPHVRTPRPPPRLLPTLGLRPRYQGSRSDREAVRS
jgi:hypothetical protein